MTKLIGKALVPQSQLRAVTGAPLLMKNAAPPRVSNEELSDQLERIEGRIADLFDQIYVIRLANSRPVVGRSARFATIAYRKDMDTEQAETIASFELAFLEVYPDTRLSAAVLRARGRPQWVVDARARFVKLVRKWRPDITDQQIATHWGKDRSTIGHLADRPGNLLPFGGMEDQWIDHLKTQGHDLNADDD